MYVKNPKYGVWTLTSLFDFLYLCKIDVRNFQIDAKTFFFMKIDVCYSVHVHYLEVIKNEYCKIDYFLPTV